MSKEHTVSIATQMIHEGDDIMAQGAICPPIFQSSIYEAKDPDSYHDVLYIRSNNTPDQRRLAKKLALLEQGEACVVTSSGMAAISSTLLTLLQSGSHVLAQRCLYGATRFLFSRDLSKFNITTDFIDTSDPDSWESLLKPSTKIIYVESMANPTLEMGDLRAVADFAKKHGLIAVIDSTFATPVNFNPITIGFDVVIHSCSKYINGHYDIVAGCVIGTHDIIQKITEKMTHMGHCLDPHVCFLLGRGMATLFLRVQQQNKTTLELSRLLEQHPKVERVNYPGLESHPQHQNAKQLFKGYGGVVSFELKGNVAEAELFLSLLVLPTIAPSVGGMKTLITRPAITSHAEMPAEERREIGISDKLLRVSVGIEQQEDIIQDFKHALEFLR